MGYIKCPRCDLNYIPDSEKLCVVCKSQIRYIEPVKRRDVEYIYDYICRIYSDFLQYLNTTDTLCDLKSFTFEGGSLPDYSNIHVRQLYLLRYAYAYAYEYKFIYMNLLQNYKVGPNISVTSIGCGNMIDYWSLVEALHESNNDNCVIDYKGLDLINWEYKVKARVDDTVDFIHCSAIDYFNGIDQFDSDIFIFPKSISEFSSGDFDKLCDCFKNKPILKDKICLIVSIRPIDKWERKDVDRVAKIVSSICSNGFYTEDNPNICYHHNRTEANIYYIDSQFKYPLHIIDTVSNLTSRCVTDKIDKTSCNGCNNINRSPMLNASYMEYQKFIFCREKQK